MLSAVAACISRELRGGEFFARYGGEEFLVIFQGENELGVHGAANRLREVVAALRIDIGDGICLRVTFSAGVAATGSSRCELPALLVAADEALYAAKRDGRNRVVRASWLADHAALAPGDSRRHVA